MTKGTSILLVLYTQWCIGFDSRYQSFPFLPVQNRSYCVYRLAANTMSRLIKVMASSILEQRIGSPMMRAAPRTSRSSSCSRWMHRTMMPSCTSVKAVISAKGCKQNTNTFSPHANIFYTHDNRCLLENVDYKKCIKYKIILFMILKNTIKYMRVKRIGDICTYTSLCGGGILESSTPLLLFPPEDTHHPPWTAYHATCPFECHLHETKVEFFFVIFHRYFHSHLFLQSTNLLCFFQNHGLAL